MLKKEQFNPLCSFPLLERGAPRERAARKASPAAERQQQSTGSGLEFGVGIHPSSVSAKKGG